MATKRTEPRNDKMLTPKEAAFVAFYLESGATKATLSDCAKRAGFPSAAGLLKRPAIRKEIESRMGKVMAKKQITAERVVEELGKIAFANIDDFVDDEYRIRGKPGRRKMAAVQEVTTDTYFEGKGEDAEEVKRVKLKMYSKLDALGQLGRHFGLFTDKVELSGDLGDRLDRAFARLAEEGAVPEGGDDGEDK
jgi:phage terminase small subunit